MWSWDFLTTQEEVHGSSVAFHMVPKQTAGVSSATAPFKAPWHAWPGSFFGTALWYSPLTRLKIISLDKELRRQFGEHLWWADSHPVKFPQWAVLSFLHMPHPGWLLHVVLGLRSIDVSEGIAWYRFLSCMIYENNCFCLCLSINYLNN